MPSRPTPKRSTARRKPSPLGSKPDQFPETFRARKPGERYVEPVPVPEIENWLNAQPNDFIRRWSKLRK